MFDSGFGGLTVARALIDLLPGEDLVYIGDTGRYPYGPKPPRDVRRYAAELAWSLIKDHEVKAVVVACNTAAASGLDELRAALPVPVLDVIGPGAASLVEATTPAGPASSAPSARSPPAPTCAPSPTRPRWPASTSSWSRRHAPVSSSSSSAASRLATRSPSSPSACSRPLVAADVDALLLGCTHYPFLARVIGDVMGPGVTLVSSADETAFAARRVLGELGLLRDGGTDRVGLHRFLSSGDIDTFRELGARLLGPELNHTERWVPGT